MSDDTCAGGTEPINRAVFDAYDRECQRLAEIIRPILPSAGEDTFDGRDWCEEHNIPESAFADAVDYWLEEADYGVSPMYPWRYEDTRGDRHA